MKHIALLAISLYQKLLSPDHSWVKAFFPYGYCRFHPTCSFYMRDAIIRYGFLHGAMRGLWRIVRCNPWNKGGIEHI
ncbi:membrane protein insertion efficiency factor YidD [Candidatus Uhrbacteria bacterium]|nr:membrane protein insertion efficiency factor YidD [Candidatus Uhrbacteria bacterium]